MKKITLRGGQKYIQVEEGFSLIPIEKAVAEVSEGCDLLFYLKYLEPLEMRERLARWILGKLGEKYGESWLEVWDAYVNSDHSAPLLKRADDISKAMFYRQLGQIVEDSGFGEE